MIAVDTNVLVRVVTRDDRDQARVAIEELRNRRIWIPKTVLLETEWVLRYSYRLDREVIAETVGKVLAYRKIEVEDREAVLKALGWYRLGMDFADALHLASGSPADELVTFDRSFASAAERLEAEPPVRLLRARATPTPVG